MARNRQRKKQGESLETDSVHHGRLAGPLQLHLDEIDPTPLPNAVFDSLICLAVAIGFGNAALEFRFGERVNRQTREGACCVATSEERRVEHDG